jgi:hypothetical protein
LRRGGAELSAAAIATKASLRCARASTAFTKDPANPVPAEEAFLAAIGIAQQQKAKSFELRAALSLAKLYQSTGHPVEAYAVLAPTLERFSPTAEFPEIADAVEFMASIKATGAQL